MNRPSKNTSPGCPSFISSSSGTTGDLFTSVSVPEQEFIGTAVTVQVVTIFGPIQVSNEGRVLSHGEFLLEVGNSEEVDGIIVRSDSEDITSRVEFKFLDPFFSKLNDMSLLQSFSFEDLKGRNKIIGKDKFILL